MALTILRSLFHSPVVDIIHHLKLSHGMTVRELAERMKMSYMGVKQHCVEMEKNGYLDSFRRAVPHGRPEKLYRLTVKMNALFPAVGCEMILELLVQAERNFGPTAPEKLLHSWFQSKADIWALKLQKEISIENKAIMLARLRTADGHMCMVESSQTGALRLVDYHLPLAPLMDKYSGLVEIECDVLKRLLGQPVERVVQEFSGLKQVIFIIKK
jgi:predicted ArsR family transcriptional regulator